MKRKQKQKQKQTQTQTPDEGAQRKRAREKGVENLRAQYGLFDENPDTAQPGINSDEYIARRFIPPFLKGLKNPNNTHDPDKSQKLKNPQLNG